MQYIGNLSSFAVNRQTSPANVKGDMCIAGCPAVTGNLWDVTDRDLDRFCASHLSCWLHQHSRHIGHSALHFAQGTHAQAVHESSHEQLAASIASSRRACHLRSLVGAAPVCYGLPTGTCQSSDL